MRTLVQPGDDAKKLLETRSHLDRGRTTSFENLGHVLAAGRGSMCITSPTAGTRCPLESASVLYFPFPETTPTSPGSAL